MPPSIKDLHEIPQSKNRAVIRNALNTVNPLVTVKNFGINQDCARKILACPPISKAKLKLDNKKIKCLKEEYKNTSNKVQETESLVSKIEEHPNNKLKEEANKIEHQDNITQLMISSKLKKQVINMELEEEKDDVLMDSISAPNSPQIEAQESSHQRFKYHSINKQCPFSDVVDKRVSEYLGNTSYISAKNYFSILPHLTSYSEWND